MELHKYLSFCNKFDLEGHGHQFKIRSKPYKGKISKVPIQKFKQIFCKFEGKFALEGQGLGY